MLSPSPTATSGGLPSNLNNWKSKCLGVWFNLQLTHHGGKYSIERALALDEYTRNASRFRVLLVIAAPLFLTIGIVLAQESIPLQNPAEGWKANYGFWCRVGFTGASIAYVMASQVQPWLDVPGLSFRQTIFYCISVGASFVTSGVVAAEIWVFPVPFMMLTLTSVLAALFLALFRIMIGASVFQQIISHHEQLRRLSKQGALQSAMTMVYPAYQVLYSKVNGTVYELPVLLLLPACKLVMKSAFSSMASHKVDMIPGEVVFTVDFFDALYMATFVQSLSSTTIIVVMAIDIADTALELRELYNRTRHIISQAHEIVGTDTRHSDCNELLGAVRELCYFADKNQQQMIAKLQVRSCLSHRLSDASSALLNQLEKHPHVTASDCFVREPVASPFVWIQRNFRGGGTVQPVTPTFIAPTSTTNGLDEKYFFNRIQPRRSAAKTSRALHDALEALFTSECLLLTEYVETIVPMIYGTFTVVMSYLPSILYHTEMVGVTPENVGGVVSRTYYYGLLEFVSLVILAVIMHRNCGIQALYQLAFVLETQMSRLLSRLVIMILITLTYRVVHFGTSKSNVNIDTFAKV